MATGGADKVVRVWSLARGKFQGSYIATIICTYFLK